MRIQVVLVATALFLVGCGSSHLGTSPTPSPGPRSPAALAALAAQGHLLLDGGVPAFEAKLERLHGYPIVVNLWAGWCPSCLADFRIFEEVAPRFDSRIAFLGVNSQDERDGASGLLAEADLAYPSYFDPDSKIMRAIGSMTGLPDTAFFGAEGELQFIRYGPYPTGEDLEADLRTLLQGESAAG